MNPNVRSALIAGVLAGVIYTVISVSTGTSFGAAVGVGVIYLIGTAIVVFVIATIIGKVMSNRRN